MTDKKLTKKDAFLRQLDKRVLIFDGAMGTMLQLHKLTAADFGGERYLGCNDYLTLSSPEAVSKIHRAYLEAGADVVETDSFRANRLTLADYGFGRQNPRDQFLRRHKSPAKPRMNSAPPRNPASLLAPLALPENSFPPAIPKCRTSVTTN